MQTLDSRFKYYWQLCFMILMAFTFVVIAPSFDAIAQANANSNAATNILCNATNLLTGGIGKAIAIIIIASLAFALFLGKVSWGMAIAVAVAMGVLFGARDVVSILAGGNTMCT